MSFFLYFVTSCVVNHDGYTITLLRRLLNVSVAYWHWDMFVMCSYDVWYDALWLPRSASFDIVTSPLRRSFVRLTSWRCRRAWYYGGGGYNRWFCARATIFLGGGIAPSRAVVGKVLSVRFVFVHGWRWRWLIVVRVVCLFVCLFVLSVTALIWSIVQRALSLFAWSTRHRCRFVVRCRYMLLLRCIRVCWCDRRWSRDYVGR